MKNRTDEIENKFLVPGAAKKQSRWHESRPIIGQAMNDMAIEYEYKPREFKF
jgi:hypothetical protein